MRRSQGPVEAISPIARASGEPLERLSAILAGLSRRGYWQLSRTLSTHTGMTNAWLAEQGVLSLEELWVNIHYPEGQASKHRLPR